MASQLAHVRGAIGLKNVGWVAEVESFTITPIGDPEDLEALEGTVGQLEPKGKRLEIAGVVFIPSAKGAHTQIIEDWNAFKRTEMYGTFGDMFVSGFGRFNAPEITDDGTRCAFTFRAEAPKWRNIL